MRRKNLFRFVTMFSAVLIASAVGAAGLENMALETARSDGEVLEITWKAVAATDELFVAGFGVQPVDTAALRWEREPGQPGGDSWRVFAGREQRVTAMYEVALLLPGESVLVGIDRLRADGSALQVIRQIHRAENGELWLGPEARGEIRTRYRVTADSVSRAALGVVPTDELGRVHLEANDPRLVGLKVAGAAVEPYMEAAYEVQAQATALVSVTVNPSSPYGRTSNTSCPTYYIVPGRVTTAPAAATIVNFDLTYQMTHSVDISHFSTAAFRSLSGSPASYYDPIFMYSGSLSGSQTLNQSHNAVTSWTGETVNQYYAVGACNLSGYSGENYTINSWTFTVYYDDSGGGGGGTIDLIADNVGVSSSSLSPGSAFSATYSGRVQGTGSVGGPFSLGFYLSNDNNITTGDILLGQRTESSAQNPGDTFSMGAPGVNLVIPGGTANGTYYVGFIVDDAGTITESNEGNNVAWTQINVSSGGSFGCVANATTLCLNDDRFKVTADWVTTQPQSGQGQAYELTADTGYFWFFNQENVETVIKVLDGCANNSRYWVFAGGLTNVQVTLRVEDMKNNTVKTYTNPQSTPFQPILDTGAFATCP